MKINIFYFIITMILFFNQYTMYFKGNGDNNNKSHHTETKNIYTNNSPGIAGAFIIKTSNYVFTSVINNMLNSLTNQLVSYFPIPKKKNPFID